MADIFTSWRDGATPDQMREIDRRAEGIGLTPFLLMEVAGLATARVARNLVGPTLSGRAIWILAGPGNNGGDGMVAARRLAGWGAEVTVLTSFSAEDARGLPEVQLGLAQEAGVTVEGWQGAIGAGDLVVDALLGFGASGEPRGNVAEMIRAANESGRPVLSVDVPSGLDATTGIPAGDCIVATATVTLALPKVGMLSEEAAGCLGDLYLADIGIPRPLLEDMAIDTDGLYEEDDLVLLDEEDVEDGDEAPAAAGEGAPGAAGP